MSGGDCKPVWVDIRVIEDWKQKRTEERKGWGERGGERDREGQTKEREKKGEKKEGGVRERDIE